MLEHAKVVPKKIVCEKIDNGIYVSAPIHIVIDKEVSKEDNLNVDEEQGVDPPKVVVDIKAETSDKSSKGNVPKCLPPYPQRAIKKKKYEHFQKFVD